MRQSTRKDPAKGIDQLTAKRESGGSEGVYQQGKKRELEEGVDSINSLPELTSHSDHFL